MACRIPHAVDSGKWQLVDVDNDIACIFDIHSVSDGFRTMYLYVESEIGNNLAQTPLVGRIVHTQSSQASAQRSSDNSTSNSMMNPPDKENPFMKDILSDVSDHEDDLLYGEGDDEDIAPDQPCEGMQNVGDIAGQVQVLVASPPRYHAMDGAKEFHEIRTEDGWNPGLCKTIQLGGIKPLRWFSLTHKGWL
ncbi:hypothetical protein PIB30_001411 [Stylosanthes scabra]|uniref:Uncharacterized protein n=1 Tax=Stylosanthes scabra TaxID=79078 RepID=A0ABU6Z3L1_9FABA|nr:hypothetical protein [Stylosanthes scabra]